MPELADKEGEQEGVTSIKIAMKGLDGEKMLSLNTTALENKINSVTVLQ